MMMEQDIIDEKLVNMENSEELEKKEVSFVRETD